MMDDSSAIEELLAGQEVSNYHKVSMISENIKNYKLTTLQETQQPNFGAVKAESGGAKKLCQLHTFRSLNLQRLRLFKSLFLSTTRAFLPLIHFQVADRTVLNTTTH